MPLKSSLLQAENHVLTPPIVWHGENLKSAFTAYLENCSLGNQNSAAWPLFGLGVSAANATLARNFDELLCLEQLQGFTPLPHQISTARTVLQELHGKAILADEVGLGKTIEAGLILKEYQLRGLVRKALILVPASLVLQWTRELNEKFRVGCYAQRNEWSWANYDIVVASLDTAKRDPHRSVILDIQWDMLIVDEAHKLKNNRTKNWQMVNQIPNKYMLLLTATPVQNNLKELHTLITLLKPGHLGNSQQFAVDYLDNPRQPKNPVELRSHLNHIMIRNRRRDGSANLPDRHVQVVPLDLSAEERNLYDAVQCFLKDEFQTRQERRISVLPLITLQREVCSSPYAALMTLEKMIKRAGNDAFRESLANLMNLAQQVPVCTKVQQVMNLLTEIEDKCIVFTEYRATQDYLMYVLRRNGITAVPFRGGFKRGKKDWMKDLFANKVRVLVATESGGEGINLQFCRHMINFDLPWNPMRLEQRIGRIHRLGQEHDVHIYNLATRNTIEAHIVQLLQDKIRMFEMVIGELDYVLGENNLVQEFEETVMKIAMTSQSDEELGRRLNQYGDEVLQRMKGDPS